MQSIRGQNWDMSIVGLSVVTVAVALFFWNAPLLLPIKLFVVLLHEISHGLAAYLTGGSMERLSLTYDEGGLAHLRGGSRFLSLSAGYLGSALWGAALLRLAWAGPGVRRFAIRGMAVALGIIGLLYVRDLFTLAYVAFTALVLYGLGWQGGPRLQMAALWVIGTFSCLYAVIDIGTDILMAGPLAGIPLLGGPVRMTDAELLATITLVPAFIWGLIWSAIAIAVYFASVMVLATRRGR
ncbi:MAG: M50 family metallopeptidase [Ardenticatenales bacterium]|nr:M50 family metallopeptidase [Ardenticatenales bacterium]